MEICENKVVVLSYHLQTKTEDGSFESIETVDAAHPFAFIFGMSGLPVGFEEQISGKKTGDTFSFEVSAENGYGERDDTAVIELDIEMFKIEDGQIPPGMLTIGNTIPMTNDNGERLMAEIVEVYDDRVVVDFNHPLAGKTMHFEGEVMSVREATAEELDHGHVHGEHGVHH